MSSGFYNKCSPVDCLNIFQWQPLSDPKTLRLGPICLLKVPILPPNCYPGVHTSKTEGDTEITSKHTVNKTRPMHPSTHLHPRPTTLYNCINSGSPDLSSGLGPCCTSSITRCLVNSLLVILSVDLCFLYNRIRYLKPIKNKQTWSWPIRTSVILL